MAAAPAAVTLACTLGAAAPLPSANRFLTLIAQFSALRIASPPACSQHVPGLCLCGSCLPPAPSTPAEMLPPNSSLPFPARLFTRIQARYVGQLGLSLNALPVRSLPLPLPPRGAAMPWLASRANPQARQPLRHPLFCFPWPFGCSAQCRRMRHSQIARLSLPPLHAQATSYKVARHTPFLLRPLVPPQLCSRPNLMYHQPCN